MTTRDEALDDSRQEYGWGLAPSHLKTRRQLREMGKSPGPSLVALMVGKRRGRRITARLFDPALAPDKRVPSDAQLAAIRKATHEHQLRAAARHGFPRAEMDAPADPAPDWEQGTPEKGNAVPDNTFEQAAEGPAPEREAQIRDSVAIETRASELERAIHQAQEGIDHDVYVAACVAFDVYLRQHRGTLGDQPYWQPHYEDIDQAAGGRQIEEEAAGPPPLDTPVGHGQRMAYLLATVAVNQARYRDARLGDAVDEAQAAGDAAVAELVAKSEQMQARAEARLQTRRQDNPAATVEALADALVWHSNSEVAAQHLRQITFDYADKWGVHVDAENFQVSLDPDFDAIEAQNYAEAWSLHDRESSVLDFVAAMPLPPIAKDPITKAISNWRGSGISLDDPRGHLDDAAARRERLDADLAAVKLPEDQRAVVSFVVDYLRGDTSSVDLLYSPVLVDPGEEARGRVPRLLAAFEANPAAAALVGEEIRVLTPADQDRVRQAGKQITRREEVDLQLWPEHVDRYELGEEIGEYAFTADGLRSLADALAEGRITAEERDRLGAVTVLTETGSLRDETNEQIQRMATRREQLRTTLENSKGLAPVERAHLTAVLADVDTGRLRGYGQLPELLFADEKTKNDADTDRTSGQARRLSQSTREAVTQRIEASGAEPQPWDSKHLTSAVSAIGDSLYFVACGARGSEIEHERKAYAEKYANLGRRLVAAGIGQETRTEIGQLLADRARQAGDLGRTAAWREQQWKAKVETAVANRNDVLAQRQAVAAGRAPRTGQARAPRAEKAAGEAHAQAQAQAQASRAAGRRQLHSMEVE